MDIIIITLILLNIELGLEVKTTTQKSVAQEKKQEKNEGYLQELKNGCRHFFTVQIANEKNIVHPLGRW